MGGGGAPSGGRYAKVGRVGSYPTTGKPNSRLDILNLGGQKIQSAFYGTNGRISKTYDYRHGGGQHYFPHTHYWTDGVRNPGAGIPGEQ